MSKLDHCPVCDRRIKDFDMSGCESDDAQRWCVEHLPEDHPMAHLKAERAMREAGDVFDGDDYPLIRAYNRWIGAYEYWAATQLVRARLENAPQDAVYPAYNGWVTADGIVSPETRQGLGLPPLTGVQTKPQTILGGVDQ